jgi:xanthine dehydrogenase large subunit
MPGVVAIAVAADVPGENNYSPHHDDPIFAVGSRAIRRPAAVRRCGRLLRAGAQGAAAGARVVYEPLPAILDVRAALAAQSYVLPSERVVRGRPLECSAQAPHRLQGTVTIGGQDHFYLEGQIAIALPQEDGGMLIHSSTQHPSEVQQIVAHALGRRANAVIVQCRRMGGGFGGKETQPALIAAAAAVLAHKTQRPVKLRLDRDADMLMTGKRHDFVADYDVGFDAQAACRR